MQIIKGLGSIYDGISEVAEGFNPNVTTMDDKNRELASSLLASGITVADIQHFVDVSRVQLDEFLTVEQEVQARMATAMEKMKPKAKPRTKQAA